MLFRLAIFFLFFCVAPAFAERDQGKEFSFGEVFALSSGESFFESMQFVATFPERLAERVGPKGKIREREPRESHSGRYDKKFYQGLSLIYSAHFVEAGDLFAELTSISHQDGYRNLTSYSYVLIDIARRFYLEGKESEAKFLIKSAIQMSPEDGRVHFAAMPFAGGEQGGSFLRYLTRGMGLLLRYPSIVLPFLSNILLVGLAGVTLSFILICIVQLSLHHRVVHKLLFRKFPRFAQLWIAPILLLLLLVTPLFFGILPAIFIWSLLISLSLNHGRWLPVLCGTLILSWGLGIKIISVTNQNSRVAINHALENVTSGNFVEQDAEVIDKTVAQSPRDPYLLFAYGLLRYFESDFVNAARCFEAVVKVSANEKPLRAAALGNLAVTKLRLGDMQSAKELLDQAASIGAGKFELLKNLSLINMATADVISHRKNYTELKTQFAARLQAVEEREGDRAAALLFLIPSSSFMQNFFKPPKDDRLQEELSQRELSLSKLLLFKGNAERIAMVGAILLLVVLPLSFRKKLQRFLGLYGEVELPKKSSLIWATLPGGQLMAGKNPVAGMVVLAAFLILLMVQIEMPVRLFEVFPFSFESGNLLPIAALIIFSIGIVVPYLCNSAISRGA